MKKLLAASLLIISVVCFGQILKLRTTHYTYRAKQNNVWSDWQDWTKASVLVSVNITDERIIIDSNTTQTYDITDGFFDEKSRIGKYYCMDSNGRRCIIEIVNENRKLYVRYNDWEHVYEFFVIK